jgi:DNA-binding response OmpR family regulator
MCKQILVVEDTVDLSSQIFDVLNMEGYDVFLAANGILALKLLLDIKVDLIITDLLMPELDGFDLITQLRIRETSRYTPILVFSAMPHHGTKAKVINLGANFYLKKPSTLEELVMCVVKLLKDERVN